MRAWVNGTDRGGSDGSRVVVGGGGTKGLCESGVRTMSFHKQYHVVAFWSVCHDLSRATTRRIALGWTIPKPFS